MSFFCEIYHVTDIIKQPNCFKNPSNPSCRDLFLTNNANCFQKSLVFKTSLSDFNKLIVSVMKLHIPKRQRINVGMDEMYEILQQAKHKYLGIDEINLQNW